jgi:oxygen-independent coproporphyrinogen-3 oxidase
VQDFDPEVQFIINRLQSFEKTKEVVDWARKHHFNSINVDLVYGLPKQTVSSVKFTVERIKELKPDRIAFYSYAHVPWKSKGQRRYTEADLPQTSDKWLMYHTGRTLLIEQGFLAIGMDHFALSDDKLYRATMAGTMHRNFMGYTTRFSGLMIGLGVSSISDAWYAFAQNAKVVEDYISAINEGKLAVFRGHKLNEEDLIIRKHILNLMCKFETDWLSCSDKTDFITDAIEHLKVFEKDGLAKINEHGIKLTDRGKPFSRNVCMALDARLYRDKPTTQIFSSTV